MSSRIRQVIAAFLAAGGLYGLWLASTSLEAARGGRGTAIIWVLGLAALVLATLAGLVMGLGHRVGDSLALVALLLQVPVIDCDLLRYGFHTGAEVSIGVTGGWTLWLSVELGSLFRFVWLPPEGPDRVGINVLAAAATYWLASRRRRQARVLPTTGGLVTR